MDLHDILLSGFREIYTIYGFRQYWRMRTGEVEGSSKIDIVENLITIVQELVIFVVS